MSNYLLGTLTSALAPLFSRDDLLGLGSTLQNSNIAISSSGIDIDLKVGGLTVTLPATSLVQGSQEGHVTFADGTHLVLGLDSADVITWSGGNSYMDGLGGNDWMQMTGGHNYVLGGGGSDTVMGASGNDHIYGYGPNGGVDMADSLSGGAGDDYIQGNAGDDTIDGGSGADRILGGQDDDSISGGDGNDSMNGNLGADTLDGGTGDDTIRGGQGNDVLAGGAGDDTIMGDMGADTMTGGAGADVFKFHGNDAAFLSLATLLGHVDTITDFTVGTDHIALGFLPAAVHSQSAFTLVDALTSATLTLTGHGSDVSEMVVGNDTYLFYSSGNGLIADSVIELQGVHSDIGLASFV